MNYTELQVTTNFSFLRGASHPEELVEQAVDLGYKEIGITIDKLKKIKTGSADPTEWTIIHLAGSNRNNRDKNNGFSVSSKSLTKK